MKAWQASLTLLAVIFTGACTTGPHIDETITSNPALGSVYLERIADRQFQAAHPIKLDRTLIAQMLRGVLVREQQDVLHTLVTGQPQVIPVFSENDIAFLAPRIADALTRAAPDQQVGFRITQTGPPTYSEKTGAAVGSSEPPLSLFPQESTVGALYAYGRSLYFMLSEYRQRQDRPDTVNMANRRVPDHTGLIRRDLLFTPDAALRPDLASPASSSDGFAKTLVIDIERLRQAPPTNNIALPSSGTSAPSEALPAERSGADRVTPAAVSELESIKSDMKKKEGELEALRQELEAIKRQLAEQAAQNGTQKSAPPKRPKNSSTK